MCEDRVSRRPVCGKGERQGAEQMLRISERVAGRIEHVGIEDLQGRRQKGARHPGHDPDGQVRVHVDDPCAYEVGAQSRGERPGHGYRENGQGGVDRDDSGDGAQHR